MSPLTVAQSSTMPSTILSPLATSLPLQQSKDYLISSALHRPSVSRRSSDYGRGGGSFHIHGSTLQPQQQWQQHSPSDAVHNNPYKAPSHHNTSAFVPPKIKGYDFRGGSQAGNMGLMMGKRISDGMPVTGKLHQSRVLLQHEHRILKRLQIVNSGYDACSAARPHPAESKSFESQGDAVPAANDGAQGQTAAPGPGLVEYGKYFNRIVDDFVDLDQAEISILIMRQLGPNLLSLHHHRFLGLDVTDGHQSPEPHAPRSTESPFPDVYTFLVFCLKAACVLEALQRANLAHLALCPTALHWAPSDSDITGPDPSDTGKEQGRGHDSKAYQSNPSSLYHDPDASGNTAHGEHHSTEPFDKGGSQVPGDRWNVNKTKLRFFDFSHSKILSHERARAPNNIVEWQIAGYMEYHLQYLAPEQTGRAETWMDHRTDIYGLGATLFSLLTMQFPNRGNDSVQILQGVLSRDLPPLRTFRPDMPPIIDDILRKMTQKQPSQRYQNAFGFKQDILQCLNQLHATGTIDTFPLGKYDVSYQFVLPNTVFGRVLEQQMISAAISQAASAYQHSLNSDMSDSFSEEGDAAAMRVAAINSDSDYYVFEDDIVSLPNQTYVSIPLSSKTLLMTPKPFDGGKAVHRGSETTDPVVRAIFVSGPSGVGKTVLIRGMATVARNSGLFAAGVFEAEESAPYSAILSCIQSVLQQLLAQPTDALASLVVAIRTAFEPNSGIGIVCDLIPGLKHFFSGTEMPESKDVPLTHSVARFHALILKLVRVISTHFFMTWLIDDIHYADENSIALLATLVNVNKRLPIVMIMTHRDTIECLMKVKQILGGNNVHGSRHTGSYGSSGSIHNDPLMDEISSLNPSVSTAPAPMTKTTAIRAAGLPLVVRGGGGVRFIKLQNPKLETIQEFLAALLHRTQEDVLPLANVFYQKSWLTIRQLVLELYRNQTIFFSSSQRLWTWEPCTETLAEEVRKLTGEEYSFLQSRFSALDCDTKKTLVCAAICGSFFSIHELQRLASTAYVWTRGHRQDMPEYAPETVDVDSNKGSSAMAGLQSALREGILVYTSVPDHLRWHHNVMRKVALGLLEGTDEKERLHYEMAKALFRIPGQEFRAASHVLQCLNMVKKKFSSASREDPVEEQPYWVPVVDENAEDYPAELDARSVRTILSLAGEKSQKSGAQDMAMAYWNAALSLLPDNCWDPPSEEHAEQEGLTQDDGSGDVQMSDTSEHGNQQQKRRPRKTALYQEALKLHLQCIEAERWRENFNQAMAICDIVLTKTTDPIDRARAYQHQIEMSVWAYSQPTQATRIAIQCLQELGLSKDVSFTPSRDEIRRMYDETHQMLMGHMEELQVENPQICTDPRINMLMEVLSLSNACLYYCNVPFLAVGVVESIKLVCQNGITKDAGRALVTFALTHATWHGCLDNAYELGRLACAVCTENHHVKFLFHLTVQQWGDHVANSIPALEETLQESDLSSDRLFHTAGMIHVSVMQVLLGRVHLRECLVSTMDLITKHIEFGPKSHGVEVMQGILQLIKCLKGQTHSSNPETIFDDNEFAESKVRGKRDKALVLVHNNSTYTMLKIVAAFVFGHYAFVNEVTSSWHDDPKSMMNFECSWISYSIFTVVGLTLVNLLRTEQEPEIRRKMQRRIFTIRDQMAIRFAKYPINHAAMFYLLEAEIADQGLEDGVESHPSPEGVKDLRKVFLLYEKAIKFASDGDFPLHQCFSYELAANCHLRYGLVTSAKCLMANACKGYQTWGARGKVAWFYKSYPEMFGSPPDIEAAAPARGLFYRPSETESRHSTVNPLMANMPSGSNGSSTYVGTTSSTSASSVSGTSPWLSGSPKTIYSPSGYGNDAASAAAAAIAESCMNSSNLQANCGGSSSNASSSGPLYHLQSSWLASPQSPELDNADLDVLDFSSVIEAMQVIASEMDLDLLLVKSLGVLNQSVGAKRCCVIISKDQELVLAASLGDMGRCESVNPPMEVNQCSSLFHGVINYVINTSTPCLVTNAKDDPRFCADEYLKQRVDLKTVLCAPILHKTAMVGVLYMEDFPERAFANKRMLVMNLLVQQLGISITNALLYQSVSQSEIKLNGLLENMPCGIALWDATAENCQYINSSWKDMTGFTPDEIKASGWGLLTHQDEVVIYTQHWRERVQAGMPCQWESRYRLRDNTYRWAIVRMLPIMSPTADNRIIQWLTVTIDIDDQRKAVQLKSNFLANMSHELRTPFSGILGMLSLLRDSSGLSHEQFEFVDMAKASCEMLIRIVDDLLNFSKLEADKVTLEYIPLCFEEILGGESLFYISTVRLKSRVHVCDLLVPLASRKGLELIILFDETLPLLLIGDPDRMKQILMNLIGNAIKFSSAGNVVIQFWHEINKREDIIRARNERSSRNMLRIMSSSGKKSLNGAQPSGAGHSSAITAAVTPLRRKHEMEASLDDSKLGDEIILHCAVKDQGIGMSPEEQKMLFVSFQQTDNGTTRKYGGTGLGLSICAQLIAHMHGKVTVESEKGKGATFTFTAKLRTETAYDEEQSPAESSRIKECTKILWARLDAIKDKRVLILSPNRQLRQQIVKTAYGAICEEYDDVASAVAGGAIVITDECAETTRRPYSGQTGRMDVDHDDSDPKAEIRHRAADLEASADSSALDVEHTSTTFQCPTRFDFILVDHVLDSAELDRIYPSPVIAFVLLLVPTTETLRWMLPPAAKKLNQEPEEPESGQLDIGGRGRIRHAAEVDYAAEKVVGHIQRTSHEASAQVNSVAFTNIERNGQSGGGGIVTTPPVSITGTSVKKPSRIPSQLFKKRKSRGHVTVTRPVPFSSSGGSDGTGRVPEMETITFQVCRLIKPVRRMKMLQILFNALSQHERRQAGLELASSGSQTTADGEHEDPYQDGHTSSSGCEYDEMMDRRRRLSTAEASSSASSPVPASPSSSLSPPGSPRCQSGSPMSEQLSSSSRTCTSLKRRREQATPDVGDGHNNGDAERKRRSKASKHSLSTLSSSSSTASTISSSGSTTMNTAYNRAPTSAGSASLNSVGEKEPPRNLGLSGAVISGSRLDTGNMPKRARNNDALTLLLTTAELESCRDKNVLVAEDDFVSQKILEKQLSKLGMNVVIANNGQEALNHWLSAERGHYSIAIFDHHMPIMDGLAATRKLRALEAEFSKDGEEQEQKRRRTRIPIVGLSADIQQSTKEACIKAGMDEYMTKPLLTKGLALLIQKYCCG
ncbi:hypothetical protein EDD11_001942 [Mortierella claussenii]|nr:hypothetical protein EDD11_001942 [Mortierella claussenii]